jgi:hypothetical protein
MSARFPVRPPAIMKVIKSYSTSVDAQVARIALDAAGVPSTVVGVDAAMEGGTAGVQLLVPDEWVDDALKVLERS